MTVSSTSNKSGPYNGNGVTTNFAVGFKYDSTSDVDVIVTVTATGVETTKTITTHYTITAPGDSGTVTFLTAPASGETVTIVRTMAMTQTMDLTAGGGLSAATVEANADTQLMQIQEIAERVSRAPKLRQSTSTTAPEFPEPEANALIAWDAAGVDLENVQAADTGDATFPVSSTDNAVVRFNGGGGTSFQNSGVIIDDSNNVLMPTGTAISWNSGDVTITHSANGLAFAGATANGYSFADGPIKPAANDGVALGISGTAFSDLFLASGGVVNWNAGNVTLTQSAGILTVGGASGGSVGVTAGQALSVSPTGNATTTRSSLSVQGAASHASTREFLVNLGLTSNVGNGLGTPTEDKVTLYSGVSGASGTGSIWAANLLVAQLAGSGNYNAQGIEIDIDNVNAHRGEADGLSGLTAPITYGATISGASTFRITAGLGIFSGNKMFNRGIVFALDSIVQASIQDLTSSTVSLDIRGTHDYGLDLRNGTFNQKPIRLPNNSTIGWRNAAGSADQGVLTLDGSNNILIGVSGFSANVFAYGANFAPATDNATSLGGVANRWSAIYGTTVQALADVDAGTAAMRIHNTGDGNVTTKLAALNFYGRDTTTADKEAVRVEARPADSNWVGSEMRLYVRASDTVTEAMRLTTNRMPIWSLGTATPETLGTNGQLTITATSNTNLRFSYRGSDGVTRVFNMTPLA